ncbi:MAG: TMEM165/GDT1 family protein [Methyloversatilis sp.]|uniref:TMEM165/GDT1 family protein n=1 Tax=Methyloversatilis sp. TaxID=2569862 RepID=UPI0025DE1513|nr:TMEM165/GDT1 family protein [Methyloversatilis sp.]MCR6667201.1 TMEM165/GDT1 family protein [Methyloversatilis sp.]
MDALIASTALVALAEIGDKTQLLSFVLAARMRRPRAICLGILVATVLNHALAAWLGALVASVLSPEVLRWIVGLAFIGCGLWALVPDKLEDTEVGSAHGVFLTSTLLFFMAEMGDKTQLATVALGARFEDAYVWVVAGTTLGMMIANVPAVYVGQRLAQRLPVNWIRRIAAGLFVATGIITLYVGLN